ncbi:MAG: ABC transporter permease [Planctomycetota bacterium]
MFGLLLVLLLVPRMTMFMRFLIVGCAGFACYLLCAPSVGVPYVFYETRSFTDPNLMQDRLLLAACIPIIIALLISPVVHWVFKILFTLAIGGLMAAHLMNVNLVRPPENVTYEQWRVASEEGQVEWMVLAPVPYSPRDRVRDVAGSASLLKPDDLHYLGTDRNSADVFSRVIHASRIAISIGFISTGIALVIGVFIGGLMGYFSGVVDMLGMRLLEMFQAIPPLFLLLTFVAFWGRNIIMIMVIIGLTSWPGYARYIRAEYLKLRSMDYVQAALSTGLPLNSILFRHMLPNGVAPVLVTASFGVAVAILSEASLSFLGLGVVDEPSWGQMLNQAVNAGQFSWWLALFPGAAIFFTVFAYNLIGEALRDAIDPHLKKVAN